MPTDISWRDGKTPVSDRFDDLYFSTEGGLAESRYVFLEGNALPERFAAAEGFHIAELGFGTGLNFLAAWQLWRQVSSGGVLRYTGFERYPLGAEQQRQAFALWPELAALVTKAQPMSAGRHELGDAVLMIIEGDARRTLPAWNGMADAWFLDGFSPAKNPQLWEASLLKAVAEHTKPGGSFATYTAAGHVRAALRNAGFCVTRLSGFGRKRHMSAGWLERSTF